MKYILLICFSFMMICGGRSQEGNNYPTVKPKALKKFKLSQGIHKASFPVNNGQTWNMNIQIPELKPDEAVPLILALHWAGNDNAYIEYSECLAFPAFEGNKAIIVAPTGDGLHWITALNEYRVINLVKQIKKHWPIDKQRIIVTGYSNGAIGAWQYTERYPKIFNVAFAQCGSYESAQLEIPIYVLHGKKDELFNAASVKNTIEASKRLGSDIDFNLLENHSHFMGCKYVSALKEQIATAQAKGHL